MLTSHLRSILILAMLTVLGMAPGRASADYTYTALASFSDTDVSGGQAPYAGVTMDAQGNLFGTTAFGGANNAGTLFEIAAGSGTVNTIASFDVANGQDPRGNLTIDAQGNLYGTTAGGGVGGYGTVFEVPSGTNSINTLAAFNLANGASPLVGLTPDAEGNLYGTTTIGGAGQSGTVFEIAAGTQAFTTIASFSSGTNSDPTGLTIDAQGNLFGITRAGGANGDGSVYEILAGTQKVLALASFNATTGDTPIGTLIMDAQGNIYGVNSQGGAGGYGTVFELSAGTHVLTTLASFNGANGANPVAGLAMDSQGNLFGTTVNGGSGNDGTVFEIAAGTRALYTLASFNFSNGAGPAASLSLDAQGDIIGTTTAGGVNGGGTVFELKAGPVSVPEIDAVKAQAGLTVLVIGMLILVDRRILQVS